MNEPETIRDLLANPGPASRSIAVVGLSKDPARPSHYVSAYLQQHGYTIYPVNPAIDTVLGEKSYPSLAALIQAGIKPDIVDVFRLPAFLPAIVDQMLSLGLKNLWVQQGIVHHQAALRAEAAGIRVVMDRCIMVEHQRAHAR